MFDLIISDLNSFPNNLIEILSIRGFLVNGLVNWLDIFFIQVLHILAKHLLSPGTISFDMPGN